MDNISKKYTSFKCGLPLSIKLPINHKLKIASEKRTHLSNMLFDKIEENFYFVSIVLLFQHKFFTILEYSLAANLFMLKHSSGRLQSKTIQITYNMKTFAKWKIINGD